MRGVAGRCCRAATATSAVKAWRGNGLQLRAAAFSARGARRTSGRSGRVTSAVARLLRKYQRRDRRRTRSLPRVAPRPVERHGRPWKRPRICCGSCSAARQLKQAAATPWQYISTTPDFEVLASLVRAANLTGALDQPGLNYTLFLPNNASFADLEADNGISVDMLLNSSTLQSILLYHVYPGGGLLAGNLTAGKVLVEANNVPLTVVDASDLGLPLAFRDAMGRLVSPIGNPATLGANVAYTLTSVLLPIIPQTIGEALNYETSLSTISSLLTYMQLQETELNITNKIYTDLLHSNSTNVTLLVPTNDAFNSLCVNMSELLNNTDYLNKTLLAHVIPVAIDFDVLATLNGTSLPTLLPNASFTPSYMYGTVVLQGNGSVPSTLITIPDLVAGNSKIDVINTVLFPDLPEKPVFECPPAPPGDYSNDNSTFPVGGDYNNTSPSGDSPSDAGSPMASPAQA